MSSKSQLRYLSLTHNGELPSSINNLRQLQCLILRRHHNIKFLTAPTTYLESLKCVVVNPRLKSSQLVVAPPDHLSKLPWRLKKLSLNGLGYSWKDMTAIASLRYLEVLKLRCSAFQGAEWETEARQFQRLKFLLLEDLDLVHWTAEANSFRNLLQLSVRHCYKLKKIPSEIGDIRRLLMMEVDDCSPSVVASALQIKEQIKRDIFSSPLQVVINSSWNL